MEKLRNDWLTEGLIDFEYKKYILLAYLKDIRCKFDKSQLYPFLSELIFHYNNLRKIKEQKELLYEGFPRSISRTDFKKLKVTYQTLVNDDETTKVIEDIIAYAIPHLDNAIKEGKELFDFISDQIDFDVVGVKPLYDQEGYLLFNRDASRDVVIYRYSVQKFKSSEDTFRGINTTFVANDFTDISRSFETIKIDLTRQFKDLPNPNTFSVISRMRFPLPETLLPIAKRMVMQKITVA